MLALPSLAALGHERLNDVHGLTHRPVPIPDQHRESSKSTRAWGRAEFMSL